MCRLPTIGLFAIASAMLACAAPPPRPLPSVAETLGDRAPASPRAEFPAAPQASGQAWNNSLAVMVGSREMDDETFWTPVDEQTVLGIEAAFRPPQSTLGFEVGVAGSYEYDDVTETFALLGEVYAGPRLTFDVGGVLYPYVAGGATYILADVETDMGGNTVTDDDASIAAYAHGGAYITLGGGYMVGVDVRGTFGSDVTLFGNPGDVDYLQYAAFVGAAW